MRTYPRCWVFKAQYLTMKIFPVCVKFKEFINLSGIFTLFGRENRVKIP